MKIVSPAGQVQYLNIFVPCVNLILLNLDLSFLENTVDAGQLASDKAI